MYFSSIYDILFITCTIDDSLRHHREPPRSSLFPNLGAAGNLTKHTGRCLPAGKTSPRSQVPRLLRSSIVFFHGVVAWRWHHETNPLATPLAAAGMQMPASVPVLAGPCPLERAAHLLRCPTAATILAVARAASRAAAAARASTAAVRPHAAPVACSLGTDVLLVSWLIARPAWGSRFIG